MKKLIMVLTVVLCLFTSTVVASAAADPNVVLVNPASSSTIYSNNLLISVKITQPKTIQVTVYEEKQMVNGTLSAVNVNTLTASNGAVSSTTSLYPTLVTTEKHTSSNNLSFYTKQVNGLKPGLYRIEVKTMDPSGKETGVSNSRVVIKEKTEEETKVFESTQSGTMQFLQSLLKSIFGE